MHFELVRKWCNFGGRKCHAFVWCILVWAVAFREDNIGFPLNIVHILFPYTCKFVVDSFLPCENFIVEFWYFLYLSLMVARAGAAFWYFLQNFVGVAVHSYPSAVQITQWAFSKPVSPLEAILSSLLIPFWDVLFFSTSATSSRIYYFFLAFGQIHEVWDKFEERKIERLTYSAVTTIHHPIKYY